MSDFSSTVANALTIAGSDSGGGAGIQADLKAFSALGVYGASVITALTAQNTREVRAVFPVTPAFVIEQLQTVFDDIRIDAVKTGMLGDADMVRAVAGFLRERQVRLVVDPVMISKSGNALLSPDAVSTLVDELLPLADLITPNLPEAAAILGQSEPEDIEDMKSLARALHKLGPRAVLLKGGHLSGSECPDLLFDGTAFQLFETPRIETQNTHGTGCTLASAITALLARGFSELEAVTQAKGYITAAIAHADQLNVGAGHGPVNHFHGFWQP
ncbi:bifunctional hydroxymethylpyrimidine kinase/phosphomethylpyrimidine kinase [Neptuniibacter halophilus]|uniref:bifunctional hydroxymethylpyrimidine kinase/phosphomethylpyrimidine kinase n=1 Tax=Neptuniibacter halophilus TaxID=651666 RepID=UPI0033059790